MNLNNCSPHIQKLQSTFSQILPKGQQYNIDFGTEKNLFLSLLNSSIIVLDHPHPLFSCLTPQRSQYSKFWTCGKCICNYNYNVPSFYCTLCNFDLCQKCFLQYQIYQIELYDYKNSGNNFNNIMINPNGQNLRMNLHNHPLKLIQFVNYIAERYNVQCLNCKNNINNKTSFYYCSLCNYYVCSNCFNQSPPPQMPSQQQFNNQMPSNQNQFIGQFQNQNQQMQFNQNQFNFNQQMQFNNQQNQGQNQQMQFNNQQNQGQNQQMLFNQNLQNQNQGFNQPPNQGNKKNEN